MLSSGSVSYTHLDVYKRQVVDAVEAHRGFAADRAAHKLGPSRGIGLHRVMAGAALVAPGACLLYTSRCV